MGSIALSRDPTPLSEATLHDLFVAAALAGMRIDTPAYANGTVPDFNLYAYQQVALAHALADAAMAKRDA